MSTANQLLTHVEGNQGDVLKVPGALFHLPLEKNLELWDMWGVERVLKPIRACKGGVITPMCNI